MFLSKTPSKFSFGLLVIASLVAGICSAADNPLWEPAKVVAVEQVSTPAKEPDASCRAVPRGATPPPRCRPSALRAEHFWRVTLDVGNKRLVVRPYRAPNLLDALSQGAPDYVDPHLTVASSIEVALVSSKAIRLRPDQGPGIAAMVDSQELLSTPLASPRPRTIATRATTASKVVLLESGDFLELETQEIKSLDIGGGAALYSFTGDSSQSRAASNNPVFLVLAESDTATRENVELSRLQVGKGVRELALAKNRSASSLPIAVTQVSATVRKLSATEPLPPGEYVILLENSNRGFLFSVR